MKNVWRPPFPRSNESVRQQIPIVHDTFTTQFRQQFQWLAGRRRRLFSDWTAMHDDRSISDVRSFQLAARSDLIIRPSLRQLDKRAIISLYHIDGPSARNTSEFRWNTAHCLRLSAAERYNVIHSSLPSRRLKWHYGGVRHYKLRTKAAAKPIGLPVDHVIVTTTLVVQV